MRFLKGVLVLGVFGAAFAGCEDTFSVEVVDSRIAAPAATLSLTCAYGYGGIDFVAWNGVFYGRPITTLQAGVRLQSSGPWDRVTMDYGADGLRATRDARLAEEARIGHPARTATSSPFTVVCRAPIPAASLRYAGGADEIEVVFTFGTGTTYRAYITHRFTSGSYWHAAFVYDTTRPLP